MSAAAPCLASSATFRILGEALASIGSVSHLTIRSRTAGDDSGSEINVRGGVIEPPVPCGCPIGTVIEVRNLFFNTPVRHRFLKTAQTERGHIVEAFTRLALANPDVHFVLTNNEKTLYDLPATTRWVDRIAAFFGAEISESLIPIDSDDSQIRIRGYVCDPSVSRGNNRMQYLFLCGRHIRDRALQHALGEAYRGMLMVGRAHVPLADTTGHISLLLYEVCDGLRVCRKSLLRIQRLRCIPVVAEGGLNPASDETGS